MCNDQQSKCHKVIYYIYYLFHIISVQKGDIFFLIGMKGNLFISEQYICKCEMHDADIHIFPTILKNKKKIIHSHITINLTKELPINKAIGRSARIGHLMKLENV